MTSISLKVKSLALAVALTSYTTIALASSPVVVAPMPNTGKLIAASSPVVVAPMPNTGKLIAS